MGKPTTKAVPPRLTDLDALGRAAECLRVLAHPHRLRMVQMMLVGQYTVGELAEACELPTAMASEHLRLMQRCGFLNSEKEGRNVFYRVVDPHLKNLMKCVEERCDAGACP
ncbi:ArsR/SmtB family transcription factor [Planctomicrobium sp. SH527]|uniref:ArsR/SmtB family transcription factor n=1 Tax=Planctomicrobium sp. SH527 TaxID=3448123 RepID=UPI003F5BA481